MALTLRETVENIVRGILETRPATSPLPSEPVQQPASIGRQDLFDRVVALRGQQERESLPLHVEAASLEAKLSEVLAQAEGITIQ
ncbi:MAG: hypothetical protein ABIU05_00875 [Nitrospirales bacterium]